jgi:hypothetical protein
VTFYLDATSKSAGVCQVEIDADTATRETKRGMFTVSEVAHGPVIQRVPYDWTPTPKVAA